MRVAIFALACTLFSCKPAPAQTATWPAIVVDAATANAEPAEDVGNADDLFQRAVTLREDRPGEAIRLFRKSAQLAPDDASLQAKVKAQLAQFEPAMRDRARAAYLLGFQLKESSPNDAARNFEHAMELTPRADPIYEKAKDQLVKLKKR